MTTTLITGANKGLGFEVARQLLAAGHVVYIGSRDAERGRQAAEELGARHVQLDLSDNTSVQSAAERIDIDGGLDVLVNNAGVAPEMDGPDDVIGAADVTADLVRRTFETNVVGTVRVLHAFLPLLRRSTAPVVVNVSGESGSLSRASTPGTALYDYPGVAFPASKAALNMITIKYARQFPGVRINAVDPGLTNTDLTGGTDLQTVEQGAEIIVRMAQIGPEGPTGTYVNVDGTIPW